MSELVIKLTGEITDSNFDGWKKDLLAQIKATGKTLKTDDDFATAGDLVKSIKSAEKALKLAKQSAIEQAADIQKLFATIDEISAEARQARLTLEKQIKIRKAEIIEEIIDNGVEQIDGLLQQQNDDFAELDTSAWTDRQRFAEAVKGKRGSSGMEKAIARLVVEMQSEIESQSVAVGVRAKRLDSLDDEHDPLFQDRRALLRMTLDELNETIDERIAFYQQEKKQAQPKASEISDKEPEVDFELEVQSTPPDKDADADTARYTIAVVVEASEMTAANIADEIDIKYRDNKHVINVTFSEILGG